VQLVRRSDKLQADGVGIDDRKALANATGLLLDLGHTRIGLLLGEAQLDTARARQAGYEAAHIARGLTPDPTLIQVGSPRARHGHDATSELLNLKIPPSSILSAGAALTEGMLDAVSEHYGTAEPTVSLLGFGDNSAFRWWRNAGLSTITLPIADIAATACERLFERITKGSAAQTNYVFVCLDTGVALRGTTTPPPLGQGQ
jgi:LacI family transcriptional regulator